MVNAGTHRLSMANTKDNNTILHHTGHFHPVVGPFTPVRLSSRGGRVRGVCAALTRRVKISSESLVNISSRTTTVLLGHHFWSLAAVAVATSRGRDAISGRSRRDVTCVERVEAARLVLKIIVSFRAGGCRPGS